MKIEIIEKRIELLSKAKEDNNKFIEKAREIFSTLAKDLTSTDTQKKEPAEKKHDEYFKETIKKVNKTIQQNKEIDRILAQLKQRKKKYEGQKQIGKAGETTNLTPSVSLNYGSSA